MSPAEDAAYLQWPPNNAIEPMGAAVALCLRRHSAHRGGGVDPPRAGAARAAHLTAGANFAPVA